MSIAKSAAARSVATLVGTGSVCLAAESKMKSNDVQVVLSEEVVSVMLNMSVGNESSEPELDSHVVE